MPARGPETMPDPEPASIGAAPSEVVDPGIDADARDVPATPEREVVRSPDASHQVAPASMEVDPFVACRYLVAATGGWRASDAIRDHRCAALDPPSPIALEKQRRLCLTEAHVSCPTFLAAREERRQALASIDPSWIPARPVVRTAPVVIGEPAHDRAFAGLLTPARLGEAALGVMAVVVVVLLGARLLGGSGAPEASPVGGAGVTGAPTPGAIVPVGPSSAPGSPHADVTAGPSGSAAAVATSPGPPAVGSAAPSPAPSASPKRTYKVKSGDTLTVIAARYGTTVTAIMKLNKIKDARAIRVGQVLRIP